MVIQSVMNARFSFRGLLFTSFFLMTSPHLSWAYPEFIGYGYKSCLLCHTNGLGGGGLSDYGRALWASELSTRWGASESELEERSTASGFLGKKEIPWWIRPSVKYRGLQQQINPGSTNPRSREIPMQLDVGWTLFSTPDQENSFTLTYGHIANVESIQEKRLNRLLLREAYFRIKQNEEHWWYVGKVERVFGLRNIDHSGSNRAPLGINQYTQDYGVVSHWVKSNQELAIQIFGGTHLDGANREGEQKGISTLYEFDFTENNRSGFSLMTSENHFSIRQNTVAVHLKQNLTEGSAWLLETGLQQTQNQKLNTYQNGTYLLNLLSMKVASGTHLTANIERSVLDVGDGGPENWKSGLGLLYFPIQRIELRWQALKTQTTTRNQPLQENWVLQGQLHVAL